MKKSIIASVVALGMVSGLAQAAVNEVQFEGTVLSVSCDLVPSVDDSKEPNGVGSIQLGDVGIGKEGQKVSFAFKPSPSADKAACEQFAASGKTIDLTWSGSKFNSEGLGALDGSGADDSNVQIKPINSTDQNAPHIQSNGDKNTFNAAVLTTDGLKYQAVLKAGQRPGKFSAAATFNVTYN